MSLDDHGQCEQQVNLLTAQPAKRAELEEYIASLPVGDDVERNRGFLIQVLHRAQSVFGYLPECLQQFVADKLGLHLSEVYGVISFYSFFTEEPRGQYNINVCTGTACFVKGSGKVLDELQRYLNIKLGETTADQRFSIGALRCVGACSLAPVVMVNDRVYGNVTTKMVPDIIADCK